MPYDMGRPPGAHDDGMWRRYPADWELRDPRFEELDSEGEERLGVGWNSSSVEARDARGRGYMGNELDYDRFGGGRHGYERRGPYDAYGEDFDPGQRGYRDPRAIADLAASREKEEELIQSALERFARARAKGKTNINLTAEEMEALERRNGQQPEPKTSLQVVSPPATPAKATPKNSKVSSRSNSATNLASQSTRKRRSSGLFGGSSSPAKSNSKAKVGRKIPAAEQALAYPAGPGSSAMMVMGPNGVPFLAPVGYYGQPRPEYHRSQSSGTKPSSRSASRKDRQDLTPPEPADFYARYPPRYYPPPSGMRPESPGSNRAMPEDVDWYPPPRRHRSTSNAQHAGYTTDYDAPRALPAAQGRRNISDPPDMRYAGYRRAPPSSPLAGRPLPVHASSDPAALDRKSSALNREVERTSSTSSSSSSSSNDDQGVQVEVVPGGPVGASGYTIKQHASTPTPKPAAAIDSRRRRRKA